MTFRPVGWILVATLLLGACSGESASPSSDETTTSDTDADPNGSDNPFCLDGTWPDIMSGESPIHLGFVEVAQAEDPNDPALTEARVALPPAATFIRLTEFGVFIRIVDQTATPQPMVITVDATDSLAETQQRPEDGGELTIDDRTLRYSATPGIASKGIDIPVCRIDQFKVTVERAGALVPPSEIHIGASSTALENPVVLGRR